MCKSYGACRGCPLQEKECFSEVEEIEEIVKMVEQWSKGHPIKTYLMDFFEKFPNAGNDAHGLPKGVRCVKDFYGDGAGYECGPESSCVGCWQTEMEG